MDYDTQKIIQGELGSDEKLIWCGRPKQGTVFRRSDVYMIPFSLLWGGFAIFWEIMAISIPNEKAGAIAIVFPLLGIPFVVVGLYIIFGRFIHDAKNRAKTFYGITNQRVIIVSGLFSKGVKSLNIKTLTDLSLSEKSDGSGTIIFGQENPWALLFGAGSFPGITGSNTPKFELIQSAKNVYNKIRNVQKLS